MAYLARHPRDGDVPSFLSAPALQPKREEGSLGGPEEGPALCLRLTVDSSSLSKVPTEAAKAPRPACSSNACAAKAVTSWKAWSPAVRPSDARSAASFSIPQIANLLPPPSCS